MPSTAHRRSLGLLLLFASAAASWQAMMIVHECGHVLGALLSGGRVARVVLHPLAFSRTDLALNPHPLLTVWAGPIFGAVFPLALAAAARSARWRHGTLIRFFAGFCLIANGAYLVSAAFSPVGDAEEMLRLGTPMFAIVAPGAVGLGLGLRLWHGMGPYFGFAQAPVKGESLAAALGSLAVLIAGMLAWSRWS